MNQFKALLSKELKEAFRDKRAMLFDVSAVMIISFIYLLLSPVKEPTHEPV